MYPKELTEDTEPLAQKLWEDAVAADPTNREAFLAVKEKFIESVQVGYLEGVSRVLRQASAGLEKLNRAQRRAKGDRSPIN